MVSDGWLIDGLWLVVMVSDDEWLVPSFIRY